MKPNSFYSPPSVAVLLLVAVMIFAYAAMRAPDPLFHWLRIDQRGSPAATLQTAAVYQTQQNITLRSLTSQVVAVTWSTASPMYASVEYKTTPFIGNTREGSFFPLTSMSPVNYTKVASTRNDLCLTDLTPSTLYYVRVWNKDSQGVESVSPVFTVSTPSPPANAFTFSKQWFGLQLAGEWRSLDSEKYDAWNKDYIRNIRVLEQWDELQPSPNQYIWSFQKNGKGYGIDDQLAEILQRDAQQPKLGSSKFIRMVLQHGGSAYGPQVPTWANEGVETLPNAKNPDDDKFLRWDPQYSCRLWQAIKTMGDRYDTNPKINTVSMPTNSRTGEMPASPSMIALWQQLNYSNNDIARNLKWYYESNANVFSESFPQKRFEMNMGQIQVPDPDNGGIDVSLSILDELATLYPKRITYGSTGAGGIRATYINRYQNKTPVGIYTEIPDANSVTPDLDLQNFFTTYIWPIGDTGGMMGYVTIKDDGLGISPTRGCGGPIGCWKDYQPLINVLNFAESKFLSYRGGPPPPPPPTLNYSLSTSGGITVVQGNSGLNTLTATLSSGTSQSISFSASGLPAGASSSFSPTSCTPTCTSTLTISTTASTPIGTYTITITGSPLAKITTFTLSVTALPPQTLTCSPSTQTVQTNSSATLTAAGGTGTYSWSAPGGNPASGSGASFSTSYVTAGAYTVTTTSGTQSAVCTVSVTVLPPPPGDTSPPSISLTAPANGSTISGAVIVSANASDDVGVVGVQFKLDGSNIGVEDTSSPYSIFWDSTVVANGSHALTAVARDAAGNIGTAPTVSISVFNGTAPLFTGRILAFGSREALVKNLQQFLIAQGILALGNDTGYFGPLTRYAVIIFQQRYAIHSTGIMGPLTAAKIDQLRGSTPPTGATFTVPLYLGVRNSQVVNLQLFLIQRGILAAGNNTGYFGPLTEAAVRTFQCQQSIVCSGDRYSTGWGVVGAKTRGALNVF